MCIFEKQQQQQIVESLHSLLLCPVSKRRFTLNPLCVQNAAVSQQSELLSEKETDHNTNEATSKTAS